MNSGPFLNITVDQWRAELERITREQTDPVFTGKKTISEFSIELGIPRSTAYTRLEKMVANGQCRKELGFRFDGRGHRRQVSVYEPVDGAMTPREAVEKKGIMFLRRRLYTEQAKGQQEKPAGEEGGDSI